jgi:hypothetical protein
MVGVLHPWGFLRSPWVHHRSCSLTRKQAKIMKNHFANSVASLLLSCLRLVSRLRLYQQLIAALSVAPSIDFWLISFIAKFL